MTRALAFLNLLLLAALGLLWALDWHLDSAARERRTAGSAFLALGGSGLSVEEVSRLELALPGAPGKWLYERRGGIWRLPQYRDGFADGPMLAGLVKSFLESRGTAVGKKPEDERHFGLAPGGAVTADFFGASGRKLLRAWAGSVAPGERSEECFLDAEGDGRILHMNSNPWSYITWKPGDKFPPLLDARVLPGALGRGPLERIAFDPPPDPGLKEIQVKEILRPPMGMGRDLGPHLEWHGIFTSGEDKLLNDAAAGGYAGFITELAFDELIGAPPREGEILGSARLAVTLHYRGGDQAGDQGKTPAQAPKKEQDTLILGTRSEGGFQYLFNATTRQVFQISAEKARKFLPDVEAMLREPPEKAPEEAPKPAPGK